MEAETHDPVDDLPLVDLSKLSLPTPPRTLSHHEEPLVSNYVVNARPMLKANDSFHNCSNRVVFHYDDRIRQLPLDRQCTVYEALLEELEDNGTPYVDCGTTPVNVAEIRVSE